MAKMRARHHGSAAQGPRSRRTGEGFYGVAMTVRIPTATMRALRLATIEREQTIRAIVLSGLQAMRIEVPPDEIRDRRKSAL